MKIVILDGHSIAQDDLDWEPVSKYGKVICYDRTPHDEDETVRRIGDAQIVLDSKVPITRAVMERCPNLKYIGVMATGYNVIDIQAAEENHIVVTNVPGYATEAVAEFVFALLLHLTRNVAVCSDSVQRGKWCESPDFWYLPAPQISLSGKTMGIIGFGQIGQKTAEIAQAFGMKVLVYTRHPRLESETAKLKFAALDELLEQADVVSLHCPLTEQTKYLIDEEKLRKMKKTAFLINTSRGPLIKERALKKALEEHWIQGAALDVIEKEPMEKDCLLLGLSNCVIAPHVAWGTKECRSNLIQILGDNIESFLNGSPVNQVKNK